jgi:hypothetical protein
LASDTDGPCQREFVDLLVVPHWREVSQKV